MSRPSSLSTGRAPPFRSRSCPDMRELGIAGLPYHGYGCDGRRYLLDGMIAMELARTDCSIATFNGVHAGLADGIDLSVRLRRAAATIPARDGALRHDRLVRADRTGRRFGGLGWAADHGAPRRRHLDSQRPEEVDRQCSLRGPDRHLGQRRRRRAGERLCGAEFFAGVHRREADAQDRAANRPERPDHAGQRASSTSPTGCSAPTRSKTPPRCCA